IAAAILLLIPKAGYKKILMFCSLGTTAAFFSAVYINNAAILYVSTLLALTGVQLHFIILSPFIAAYTEGMKEKGINWYTRTYYMGYIGYFLATYLGGALVVKMFSMVAGITFDAAKEATRFIEDMSGVMHSQYLQGNRIVLVMVGIVSLLSIIPILLIKEEKDDYQFEQSGDGISLKEKVSTSLKLLLRKEARAYLLYWAFISFAMGLFTSYYTVYLNRVLHIDKVTSSLLVSISYIAIVLFMFFTPFTVKKLGKKGTIVFTLLLSIPFMLIIANGDKFGTLMVPIVGIALFIRAGLANLSSPADSALSMDVVPKDLRPIYTALVNFTAGIVSIISGMFTGSILFVTLDGYRYAYYIAAVLYAIAAIILLIGLKGFKPADADD
ncbi:MAG: MFS transporter, partial [Holdemanella sp.]|nr:MFS transporter [Holdemanella sp.]